MSDDSSLSDAAAHDDGEGHILLCNSYNCNFNLNIFSLNEGIFLSQI